MGQCDEQKVVEGKVVVHDKFFLFQKVLMDVVFLKLYIYSISFGIEGLT